MAGLIDRNKEEQERLEEFKKSFPCNTCNYRSVCRYKDTIKVVEIPENFVLHVTCTYKDKLDEEIGIKNG